MNLPSLIQQIYGTFSFTGLYSFEFVTKNRDTITEIFFMVPPKGKTVSEPTRSTTVPTLGGNYVLDGGNATKTITLQGELYFPYVGSPDHPVARDNSGLENSLSGFEEFVKLRWMTVRYRDYTMTKNGKTIEPTTITSVSPEISRLYKKISKKINDKTGALYDEIRLIFHDYDMDDHFFCRVDNFSSSQSASRHIAIETTISIECYEPDYRKKNTSPDVKKSASESINIINEQLTDVGFDTNLSSIQAEIGYNTSFLVSIQYISSLLSDISDESDLIQAGKSTPGTILPQYISELLENLATAQSEFLVTFLSTDQRVLYDAGTMTLDELVDMDLWVFYNSLQKLEIFATSMLGVLESMINIEEIRYYADANDYLLTEEQFDDDDALKTEQSTSFYFYTVVDGDTARIIALRELNNQDDYVKILKLNDITENDFIDGILIGEKIKIPFPVSVAIRGDDNLVFEPDFTDIEKFLFGSDLSTSDDGSIEVSGTGDALGLIGIENVYNSIETRIASPKGSLNIFNPDWGIFSIGDGNAPLFVNIERFLTDVVSQIQSDPRVDSVKMNLDKLEWSGETLSVPMNIFFIGSEETREVTVNG